MDDRTATVYAIRNTVTGEQYIGGTTNMAGRRKHHLHYLRHGEHVNRNLQAAFDQHGEDAFEFVELIQVQPDHIIAWEDAMIFVHDPAYNIFPTAGSPEGYRHSLEARARMSEAHIGMKHTPETRAKISASNRGKKRDLETRARMSAAQRGREISPEHRAKIAASMRAYHAQRRADCVV